MNRLIDILFQKANDPSICDKIIYFDVNSHFAYSFKTLAEKIEEFEFKYKDIFNDPIDSILLYSAADVESIIAILSFLKNGKKVYMGNLFIETLNLKECNDGEENCITFYASNNVFDLNENQPKRKYFIKKENEADSDSNIYILTSGSTKGITKFCPLKIDADLITYISDSGEEKNSIFSYHIPYGITGFKQNIFYPIVYNHVCFLRNSKFNIENVAMLSYGCADSIIISSLNPLEGNGGSSEISNNWKEVCLTGSVLGYKTYRTCRNSFDKSTKLYNIFGSSENFGIVSKFDLDDIPDVYFDFKKLVLNGEIIVSRFDDDIVNKIKLVPFAKKCQNISAPSNKIGHLIINGEINENIGFEFNGYVYSVGREHDVIDIPNIGKLNLCLLKQQMENCSGGIFEIKKLDEQDSMFPNAKFSIKIIKSYDSKYACTSDSVLDFLNSGASDLKEKLYLIDTYNSGIKRTNSLCKNVGWFSLNYPDIDNINENPKINMLVFNCERIEEKKLSIKGICATFIDESSVNQIMFHNYFAYGNFDDSLYGREEDCFIYVALKKIYVESPQFFTDLNLLMSNLIGKKFGDIKVLADFCYNIPSILNRDDIEVRIEGIDKRIPYYLSFVPFKYEDRIHIEKLFDSSIEKRFYSGQLKRYKEYEKSKELEENINEHKPKLV